MSVPFSTKISRRSAVSDGSVEQVNLTSTSATSDPVQTFNRFKTTYEQILSTDAVSQSQSDPNQNQPISCQALLASGANAVIASSDPDGKHTLPPSGSTIYSYLFNNFYNADEHDNDISRLEQLLAGKVSVLRLGPSGQSPTAVDRTAVTSDYLVTEQSLLGWMQGQLTQNGASYIMAQPKLYITDATLTTEITTVDGNGNPVVEFVKARVNSSKDGGFDGTDDRRLATNLAINQHLVANYQPLGGSSGSSSSLTIDTEANATSTATRTAQVVGTGIFYQNGTELRVQYKSSSSNYQDVLLATFDTTSPVITITGDNPASVTEGATYTDAGATASDNVDGDVTSSITTVITDSNGAVVSSVDTSTANVSYSVTYSVSDLAGNIGSAIRTVNVTSSGPTIVASLPGPYSSPTNVDVGTNLPSGTDAFAVSFEVNFGTNVSTAPTNFWFWGQQSAGRATICSIIEGGKFNCGHYQDDVSIPAATINTYFDGNYHTIVFTRKEPGAPAPNSEVWIDGVLIGSDNRNGPTGMTPTSVFQIANAVGFGGYTLEAGMEIRNIVIYDTYVPP